MQKIYIMKKLLIIVFVFTSFISLKAQSYLGFLSDNYSGVHGIISNPANIVDSRFNTDINLVSGSLGVTNDAFGVNIFDALNADYKFDKSAKKYYTANNNFQVNVDILGPSFMFNINKSNAIALSSRLREIGNVSNVDGAFFNRVSEELNNTNFISPAQNFNIVQNGWAEFGLTYAAVLINNDKNFFKAGLTVKYLSGLQNVYGNANNLSFAYKIGLVPSPKTNKITTTGEITAGGVDAAGKFSDKFEFNAGTGFGADLGFIYEYRPNIDEVRDLKDKNKYLIKLGFSVTDFGSIDYTNNKQSIYNVNATITEEDYDASSSPEELLRAQYILKENLAATKYSLPTSAHFNLDWNVYNKFYINANADYNINSKTAINTNTIGNNYSITPRIETKWFSLFVPLNLMEYSGFQAGAGMRLGPLTIGSGSIITNFISDDSKAADFYLGLKIPVYQGRIKDLDSDGVLDKNDECPDEFGPLENKGCPYRDSDKDGTLDKDDSCKDVAGAKDNKGCPYPDTDKDGTLDKEDKCVNEAGPKENNGCPYLDSDNDGILDKDDKCPTVFGIAANNGCPEVKIVEPVKVEPVKVAEEVIKKINEFSKTILFDTGKATLKSESNTSLDAIVTVLNEYQSANFKIEGHTDSAGISAKNLKLSKDRAAAVKQYLIDKGVRADRLTSEGYGSKKPIASNKTPKGKNLNRRVEINLVK